MAGLRLREHDMEGLAKWTEQRWRQLVLPDMAHYAQLLAQDSAAGRNERELLTVRASSGESYFLRDPAQLELISSKLLPELMARRASQRSLHLWSAGCASGEEAYSLAMLVDELVPQLEGWQVSIWGTDINSQALQLARQGRYREWSFRTLDDARKKRYFEADGDQWQIVQALRDRVRFRQLDLLRDPFPEVMAGVPEFDLILCRNVFIYLDGDAVRRITAQFGAALASDGYLVTGHNELFGQDMAAFRVHVYPQSAVLQKKNEAGADAERGPAPAPMPRPAAPDPLRARDGAALAPAARAAVVPALAEDLEGLLLAARNQADRGQAGAAQEGCRQAIALAPFDPRPYFLLAQLALERGDTGAAKDLLYKVIYLDPESVCARLELGSLHAQHGDLGRAGHMYQAARSALLKLPADSPVPPYGACSAADVLVHIERLLAEPTLTTVVAVGCEMPAESRH
jgi:chemotaxis protein methyltransferase CheR